MSGYLNDLKETYGDITNYHGERLISKVNTVHYMKMRLDELNVIERVKKMLYDIDEKNEITLGFYGNLGFTVGCITCESGLSVGAFAVIRVYKTNISNRVPITYKCIDIMSDDLAEQVVEIIMDASDYIDNYGNKIAYAPKSDVNFVTTSGRQV